MLIELFFAVALQMSGEPQPSRFDLAGAYIGMRYADLRKTFPNMTCKASCADETAEHAGVSGRLWVGIGNGVINQMMFVFKPPLNNTQMQVVQQHYVSRYGQITRIENDCEVWRRASGEIALCLRKEKPYTYWHDANFMNSQSDIPDDNNR